MVVEEQALEYEIECTEWFYGLCAVSYTSHCAHKSSELVTLDKNGRKKQLFIGNKMKKTFSFPELLTMVFIMH